MLARLSCAPEMSRLRLTDIDWNSGMQVIGKDDAGAAAAPQDVGDALLNYLECRPANIDTDRLHSKHRPYRPFLRNCVVRGKHALKRAGIETSAKGAHLLRHTAATEMLRNGVPLDQAGLVLRHRSIDMTAYYAKVDVALLKQVAQPWPEVMG
jgi:integrase